jgi:pyrroloquinoline quinone (PQQ) biosynthesis protein C
MKVIDQRQIVVRSRRGRRATYKWLREHSHYDDEHPQFALQIVKHYALTERMQRQVMLAAKRSLELLDLALTTSTNVARAKTGDRLCEAA